MARPRFSQLTGQVELSCLPPGVPCDESPKGAAGKPTVCHNLQAVRDQPCGPGGVSHFATGLICLTILSELTLKYAGWTTIK